LRFEKPGFEFSKNDTNQVIENLFKIRKINGEELSFIFDQSIFWSRKIQILNLFDERKLLFCMFREIITKKINFSEFKNGLIMN
jgi:hypothetical protein